MTIETDSIILPAFLASALINGDTSSLSDADETMLNDVHELCARKGWRIVDCGEPFFSYSGRTAIGSFSGELAEYTIFVGETFK